jgi:glutamate N-acetyltransferase/amino-acid N-acetyltransferase
LSVTGPEGFRAAASACGIKPQGLDLALLVAERTCTAAGVFTTNRAQAAPVVVAREHLAGGRARALVVNSGCANAGTGARGLAGAREMAAIVARELGCQPGEVLMASTGVIGVHLPMERVRAGIASAAARLDRAGGDDAARAILTTDTRAKQAGVEVKLSGGSVRIGAMAKGSGMIAPRMATLLAFFTTDATVEAGLLRDALRAAVGESLNRISVDGDTSTNDAALILASGAAPAPAILERGPDYDAFRAALGEVARELAGLIVRDGEGVTRVAEVRVEGARHEADADRIARTVAESPLVKTALAGGDPNWGRVLAALGRAGVDVEMGRVDLYLGDVWVAAGGAARDYDEAQARRAMLEDPVRIRIGLGQGGASGWIWTCDLSHGYIEINAHYRS